MGGMPPDVPPPEDRPPGGSPPDATPLPPPVLEGGLLEEEPPEVEGLGLPDELEPAGRMPGVEPLAGLGALPGGRGSAEATAEPGAVLVAALLELVGGVVVGTRDIAVLWFTKTSTSRRRPFYFSRNRNLLGSGHWETR